MTTGLPRFSRGKTFLTTSPVLLQQLLVTKISWPGSHLLLCSYLWSRLTRARVLVTVAYEAGTAEAELEEFRQQLARLGVETRLVRVEQAAECDCVTQVTA